MRLSPLRIFLLEMEVYSQAEIVGRSVSCSAVDERNESSMQKTSGKSGGFRFSSGLGISEPSDFRFSAPVCADHSFVWSTKTPFSLFQIYHRWLRIFNYFTIFFETHCAMHLLQERPPRLASEPTLWRQLLLAVTG